MPSNEAVPQIERLYREYKPLLGSIAYRMLGSMSEAEDAVQDVFVTLSKLRDIDIAHPKAYLIRLITNRALNILKAAPRRREHYPGPWLPEPVVEPHREDEPSAHMLRRERLGYALLVLLQSCTPPERAVFVLRESLGYDYSEIAAMLDKSESACRKIFSRATAKIGRYPRGEEESALDASLERFAQLFAQAVRTGQLEPFIGQLTDRAVLLSDGGGVVRAALKPILGRERIGAFFAGIARKGSLAGELRPVTVSGQRGLILLRGQRPPFVFTFEPTEDGSAIQAIYQISNPEKLSRVTLD